MVQLIDQSCKSFHNLFGNQNWKQEKSWDEFFSMKNELNLGHGCHFLNSVEGWILIKTRLVVVQSRNKKMFFQCTKQPCLAYKIVYFLIVLPKEVRTDWSILKMSNFKNSIMSIYRQDPNPNTIHFWNLKNLLFRLCTLHPNYEQSESHSFPYNTE